MAINDIFVPLAGGVIIGIAAITMMLALGRIAGVSGIVYGLLPGRDIASWRYCFVLGMLAAPVALAFFFNIQAPVPRDGGWVLAVVSGLIVGLGTALGSGCTSGHGVCGIARISKRSLVATAVFMAVGVFTATVVQMMR